jgi:hypothetical protein
METLTVEGIMGRRFAVFLALALLAAPAAADHGVKRNEGGGQQRCRNANDPAKCEARVAAQEACRDRPAEEQKSCVADRVCADAGDPKRCRANEAARTK